VDFARYIPTGWRARWAVIVSVFGGSSLRRREHFSPPTNRRTRARWLTEYDFVRRETVTERFAKRFRSFRLTVQRTVTGRCRVRDGSIEIPPDRSKYVPGEPYVPSPRFPRPAYNGTALGICR